MQPFLLTAPAYARINATLLWIHDGAIRLGNLPRLRSTAQMRLKMQPFLVHDGAIRPSNLGKLRSTVQMRLKLQAFLVDCAGVLRRRGGTPPPRRI